MPCAMPEVPSPFSLLLTTYVLEYLNLLDLRLFLSHNLTCIACHGANDLVQESAAVILQKYRVY